MGVRKVRTQAGVKRFNAPIGTPIVADPVSGKLKAAKKSLARLDSPSSSKKSSGRPGAKSMRKRIAKVERDKRARSRTDIVNDAKLRMQVKNADKSIADYERAHPDTSPEPPAEARKVAQKHLSGAMKHEPEITRAVGTTAMRHGATMNGLGFRKKTEKSFARKIDLRAEINGTSLDEEAASIKDAVRYTAMVKTENYWEAGDEILADLVSQGHKVTKDKGAAHEWPESDYRGRNVQLEDANGVPYELQFHTKESFDAKETNHGLYEKMREKTTSEADKVRIAGEMAGRFAAVPVPPGTKIVPARKK